MSFRYLRNTLTRSEKRTKTLAPMRLAFENLEDRRLLTTIYGITPGNVLIRFDSATPALITSLGAVSDLGINETIRGIDYRPRTGQLFASTVATGSVANSVIRTYVVNPDTAQATFVGATAAALAGAGDFASGYDFNPTVDRIRYVNANDENARLNPNDGSLAGDDTDLTPAATTAVIAAAYDRNFDRQAVTVPANNVIPTTLYVINRVTSSLAVEGGVDGVPSPNGGVITDIGPLGFTLNGANDGGFDIAPGAGLGRGFAALTAADGFTRLYAIDLDSNVSAIPRATAIGLIGGGTFEVRSIAAVVPNNIEVIGSDAGVAASVKVIDAATGFLIGNFGVFGASFKGGVRVAAGDVNGDGITDVIVGQGTGTQPRILVVDGTKLNFVLASEQIDASALLASFLAYDSRSAKGVFVAAGDVNGDGRADIIAGPGGGALPVKVYDGAKLGQLGGMLTSFLAYQPTYKEGVTVAAGDVNGDGRADVITGMANGGSRVNIVDATKLNQIGGSGQIAASALLGSFLAFAPSYHRGVFVGAGDVSGDGRLDVLIGAGAGSPPTVKVVDANRLNELTTDGRIADAALLQNFLAFDASYTGGVRVGAVDVNLDGLDDLIVGTGAKNRSRVRVLDGATLAELDGFVPFANAKGAFVAGG